jgi:hypothetical protein
MPHFPDFNNMSARMDSLIDDQKRINMRIPVSRKHHISMSISRIGLFKTGGIVVKLVSLNKAGALFSTVHHSLVVSKDITIELSLNGRRFKYNAHIVQQDLINNLYGIKFEQSLEVITDYLEEFKIYPHYDETAPKTSSIWLDLATA